MSQAAAVSTIAVTRDYAIWVVIAVCLAVLIVGTQIPLRKRNLTPQQLADELEKHLLGTEGKWDWDYVTSSPLADARMHRLQRNLPKFDLLTTEKKQDEFKEIIAALRRGEVPEVKDE